MPTAFLNWYIHITCLPYVDVFDENWIFWLVSINFTWDYLLAILKGTECIECQTTRWAEVNFDLIKNPTYFRQ